MEDVPELPHELDYIWQWFCELFTGEVLTFSEIKAWSDLMGNRLQGWEVELIKSLDRIFWSVNHGHIS